jgi:hypothetical protein
MGDSPQAQTDSLRRWALLFDAARQKPSDADLTKSKKLDGMVASIVPGIYRG